MTTETTHEVSITFPWDLYVSANERLVPRGDRLVSSSRYRDRIKAAHIYAPDLTSPATRGPDPCT